MHILFVSDGDDKYGAAHAMYRLVNNLLELDGTIKISVILPRRSRMKAAYRALGCDVYPVSYQPFWHGIPSQKWKLPIKYILYGAEYLYGRICGIRKLEKKLDVGQIDVIHSNSSREDIGAKLALKYDKPMIWHIREFGDPVFRGYSYRRDPIRLMNTAATELVAVSDAVRVHWIGKGITAAKIKRIYDGADGGIPYAAARKNGNDMIRLVMMGTIMEFKGQMQLLEAIAKLPPSMEVRVSVDFVGGGNRRYIQKLKQRAKKSHIEKQISFLGYQEDFCSDLKNYDCGFVCSRAEGFGLATVEYMMAGLPVIASDSGANPEVVKDGITGLLYRFGDADDLRKKIMYMIENRERREQMGAAALKHARENFSAESNARAIYREYISVLKG